MKESLLSILTGDSGLSSLVGTRIYGGRFPQNFTRPAITFYTISDGRDDYHDAADEWRDTRVQFDVVAGSLEAMEAVSEALISCLTEMDPQQTQGSTTFTRPVLDNAIDFNDDTPARSDYRKSIDFTFSYKE